MWVFTQHGFYSVVAARPSKDRSGKLKKMGVTSDDTHVLVRARVKEDLEDLRDTYMPDLEIFTETSADYSHRCYMTRQEWKGILAVTVDELDYDSHFKEASRDGSKGAPGRYSAYMGVWSELARLQSTKPYGYSGGSYTGTYSGGSTTPVGPTWEDDGEPLGTLRSTHAAGYHYDKDAFGEGKYGYIKKSFGKGAKGVTSTGTAAPVTTTPNGRNTVTLEQCKALLITKATEDFTTNEVASMDEEAFELYKRADELPPSKQPVTRLWVEQEVDLLNEQWLEALEECEAAGRDINKMSLEEVLATLPDVSNEMEEELEASLNRTFPRYIVEKIPADAGTTQDGWQVFDTTEDRSVGSFFTKDGAESYASSLNDKETPPALPTRIYDPLTKGMVDVTDANRARLLPPGALSTGGATVTPAKPVKVAKGVTVEDGGKTIQVIPVPTKTP